MHVWLVKQIMKNSSACAVGTLIVEVGEVHDLLGPVGLLPC